MKRNYVIILALFYFLSCKTNKPVSTSAVNETLDLPTTNATGSLAVTDTLSYAKEIIANKDKYINKELSVLLNDLKISVKSYSIINSRFDVVKGIMLSFDDRIITSRKQAQDDDTKKPGLLQIIWKTPIPAAKHNEIIQKSTSKGEWQAAEQEFYPKQIVGNIY